MLAVDELLKKEGFSLIFKNCKLRFRVALLNLQVQQLDERTKHARLVQQHHVAPRNHLLLLVALDLGPAALRQVQDAARRLHAQALLGHVQLVEQLEDDAALLAVGELLPARRQLVVLHLVLEGLQETALRLVFFFKEVDGSYLNIVLKLGLLGVAVQFRDLVGVRVGVRVHKV